MDDGVTVLVAVKHGWDGDTPMGSVYTNGKSKCLGVMGTDLSFL